jgi:glycosyltransferase involved in cell wall biosynthesis
MINTSRFSAEIYQEIIGAGEILNSLKKTNSIKERSKLLSSLIHSSSIFPEYTILEIYFYFSRPDIFHGFNLFTENAPVYLRDWTLKFGVKESEIDDIADSLRHHKNNVPSLYSKKYNLIGNLKTVSGIGASSRYFLNFLKNENMLATANSINFYNSPELPDNRESKFGFSYPMDKNQETLIVVNGDHMRAFSHRMSKNWAGGRKKIGYWTWELDQTPQDYKDGVQFVDEVWVPTTFVAKAFEGLGVNVKVVPIPILDSKKLEKNSDGDYFLFVFDAASCVERKNLYNAIKFFKKAFPNNKSWSYKLVIKALNAKDKNDILKSIQKAVNGYKNISVITEYMDDYSVNKLINNSFCVYSPHRSEGFGLVLAEAMRGGKLVCATGYSGNMDFMNNDNSYLFDYNLVTPNSKSMQIYRIPNALWAEPKEDDVIDKLRFISERYDKNNDKKIEAAKTIKNFFGSNEIISKISKI